MSADTAEAARAALARGDAATALRLLQPLLGADTEDAVALLAANAALKAGAVDTALEALQILLRRHPADARLRASAATLLSNRGAQRREQGEPEPALRDFRRAVELQPAHPQAWYNAALALRDLGRDEEALRSLHRHLGLAPDDEAAQLQAARLAWRVRPAEAVQRLQALHDPQYAGAALNVAIELGRHGESEAVAAYAAVSRLGGGRPALRAELGRLLSLPSIPDSDAAIDAARERFGEGLDALERDWDRDRLAASGEALEALAFGNFLLAYHGRDDRPLQTRYASWLSAAARALAPALADPVEPPRRARPRIGLVSSFWRECTVGAYFGCWVRWLSEAGYEVQLHQLGPRRDATTTALAAGATSFHFHEGPLENIAGSLREAACDLLLYPELGMDDRVPVLACLQPAPRQATGWGHPVTTGLALDAFFSCAEMEPGGAASHYSEPLRLLPGLGVDYARPPLPPPLPRSRLGLPDAAALVLVPHSLFKLHPELDPVLAGIAARDDAVRFVLFEGELPGWRVRLEQRLAQAGLGPERLLWLPRCDRSTYLAVNRACDLMLDPPHWSGGNASLDALLCGLPVVGVPGRFMRGRQSLAMFRQLRVEDECTAADTGALVERALALLQRRDLRAALRHRIADGLPRLFDAAPARQALLGHVDALLAP